MSGSNTNFLSKPSGGLIKVSLVPQDGPELPTQADLEVCNKL